MALPSQHAITWSTDYVGANVLATGPIKKLETDVGQLYSAFVDEDAMTSDSAAKFPSQQSVKAYADLMLKTDGTKGRVIRMSSLTLDGKVGGTACDVTMASLWNGDAHTVETVTAGDSTSYTITGAGNNILTIKATAITGDAIAAIAYIGNHPHATEMYIQSAVSTSAIVLTFTLSDGSAQDIRAEAFGIDTVYVLYITSA